jgi:hypothetical protein
MNPFKFLALSGAGYLALVIVFGSGGEAAPSPTVRVPQTVQIVPLTQEQEADRQEAILQEIADLPVETTTTLPQLAQIDPDTKCQEWLTARRRDGLAQRDPHSSEAWSGHVEGIALYGDLGGL